jgi:hypothetical protein
MSSCGAGVKKGVVMTKLKVSPDKIWTVGCAGTYVSYAILFDGERVLETVDRISDEALADMLDDGRCSDFVTDMPAEKEELLEKYLLGEPVAMSLYKTELEECSPAMMQIYDQSLEEAEMVFIEKDNPDMTSEKLEVLEKEVDENGLQDVLCINKDSPNNAPLVTAYIDMPTYFIKNVDPELLDILRAFNPKLLGMLGDIKNGGEN